MTYEAATAELLSIKEGKADVVGNRAVLRDRYFYVEGFKNRPMGLHDAAMAVLKRRRAK